MDPVRLMGDLSYPVMFSTGEAYDGGVRGPFGVTINYIDRRSNPMSVGDSRTFYKGTMWSFGLVVGAILAREVDPSPRWVSDRDRMSLARGSLNSLG